MLAGLLLNLPNPQRPISTRRRIKRYQHDLLLNYRMELGIIAEWSPAIDDDLMLALGLITEGWQ